MQKYILDVKLKLSLETNSCNGEEKLDRAIFATGENLLI